MKTEMKDYRTGKLLALLLSSLLLVGLIAYGSVRADGERPSGELPLKAYLPIAMKPKPLQVAFEPYIKGFSAMSITAITHAGDDRLFIAEQIGRIQIAKNGALIDESDPFLDITDRVPPYNASGNNWEEGLLGLAFHPNYPTTPYFYVLYTGGGILKTIKLSRFTVSSNPDKADPDSELVLMRIGKSLIDPQDPSQGYSPVHNGGDIAFGPDGYLYIPIGDGGPDPYTGVSGDPDNDSQRLDKLLGKILRIDVDGNGEYEAECGRTSLYTVPQNPYTDDDFGPNCDEIWAAGLRNPWRMSFDRDTGDLYIADVGEWRREEINYVQAGTFAQKNFGWNCYEGTDVRSRRQECLDQSKFTFPVFEYPRVEPPGTAVTGGYVYRGAAYPELQGYYLFSDFMSGETWAAKKGLNSWNVKQMANAPIRISTYGEDVNGEMYAAQWVLSPSFETYMIYKVVVP